MELPGSSYLYTLALISITFAGFAALIAAFRQTIGGRLSDYDVFFIRNTLLRSFMVAGCGMLPPLLALYELSHTATWRLSSLITAILLIVFTLTSFARRRAVTGRPMTKWFEVNAFLQVLTSIFCLVIAQGTILEPGPGNFSVAVTAIMLIAGVGYMASLQLLLQGDPKENKRK